MFVSTAVLVRQVGPGFNVAGGVGRATEDDQPGAHVLVDRVVDDFVLSLEVVDAVLLVRELPAALGALEGVLFAALVLQVAVEVVVPVVRPLAMRAGVHLLRLSIAGLLFDCLGLAALLTAALFIGLAGLVGGLPPGALPFRPRLPGQQRAVVRRKVGRWS